MVRKETTFTRTLHNHAKLGAYYTDVGHAKRLGQLFLFGEETCLLEPSIGDGSAVKGFLEGAEKNGPVKIFGVELNMDTYSEVESTIDYALCADFLEGVRISNRAFSICFTNPPYGACGENGSDRLEKRFVERIFHYLVPGGFLIAILPMAAMRIESVVRSLLARFEPVGLYRFDDEEYAKYHQIAFIGKRKKEMGVFKSEWQSYFANDLILEKMPYLPLYGDAKLMYEVPLSFDKGVELFTTQEFQPQKCMKYVAFDGIADSLRKSIFLGEYEALRVGRPPMPLKKDLLYLCSVAGAGEGIAGTEEAGDVHLQRGVVRKTEVVTEEIDEKTGTGVERVVTSYQISLNFIDNFGNCGTLT